MRVVIQAGGKGTRIAEYFPDLPKPMIPITDKPLLQHQIEMLATQGFKNITITIGYKADIIKDYFGNGEKFGVKIEYITEEFALGTGGALTLLSKEDTLVLFGDVYVDVDFNKFIDYHNSKNADITLFAHPNNHPFDSDVVVTDLDGRVVEWASKKDTNRSEHRNLVNAGLYVFSADMFLNQEVKKCDLEHDIIIPKLDSGKIFAYRSTEYVKDMGRFERLTQVKNDISSGLTTARSLKNKQKAIFIDRDGTINVHDGFITKPKQIELIEGVAEAIKKINKSEYLAICITNQPVIARGDVTFQELDSINARVDTLLGEQGAFLDDLFFCPHHTDRGFEGERIEYKIDCECRKPKPGLIYQAAERYNIDLSKSYMIGDSDIDIKAGEAAGCKSILVNDEYTLLNVINEILD